MAEALVTEGFFESLKIKISLAKGAILVTNFILRKDMRNSFHWRLI
jgi:hypothetical protein